MSSARDDIEGIIKQGHNLAAQKKYGEAIECYSRVIEMAPKKDYYTFRALTYISINGIDQAICDFTQAIELDPTDSYAFGQRGALYLQKEQRQAGQNDLIRARELALLQDYVKNTDIPLLEAKEHFEARFGNNLRTIASFQVIAASAMNARRYQRAFDALTQSCQLFNASVYVQINRALLLCLLDKPLEANKILEPLFQKQTPPSQAYYVRGIAKCKSGQQKEGMKDIEQGFDLEKNHDALHDLLISETLKAYLELKEEPKSEAEIALFKQKPLKEKMIQEQEEKIQIDIRSGAINTTKKETLVIKPKHYFDYLFELISYTPRDPYVFYERAKLAYSLKKYALVIADCKVGFWLSKNAHTFFLDLLRKAFLAIHDLESAIQTHTRLIELEKEQQAAALLSFPANTPSIQNAIAKRAPTRLNHQFCYELYEAGKAAFENDQFNQATLYFDKALLYSEENAELHVLIRMHKIIIFHHLNDKENTRRALGELMTEFELSFLNRTALSSKNPFGKEYSIIFERSDAVHIISPLFSDLPRTPAVKAPKKQEEKKEASKKVTKKDQERIAKELQALQAELAKKSPPKPAEKKDEEPNNSSTQRVNEILQRAQQETLARKAAANKTQAEKRKKKHKHRAQKRSGQRIKTDAPIKKETSAEESPEKKEETIEAAAKGAQAQEEKEIPYELPEAIRSILHTLSEDNESAYVVGGSARGKSNDVDIVTTRERDTSKKRLEHYQPKESKEKKALLTLSADKTKVDIWKSETLKKSMLFDAYTRDFTINALYVDKNGKRHDPSGRGLSDLAARRIETIRNAMDSFSERNEANEPIGSLRILRAIRLQNKTGFNLSSGIKKSIPKCLPFLKEYMKTRLAEVNAQLINYFSFGDFSQNIAALEKYGVLKILFGDLSDLIIKEKAWLSQYLESHAKDITDDAKRLKYIYAGIFVIASKEKTIPDVLQLRAAHPLLNANFSGIPHLLAEAFKHYGNYQNPLAAPAEAHAANAALAY